jgi:hypothetical protein
VNEWYGSLVIVADDEEEARKIYAINEEEAWKTTAPAPGYVEEIKTVSIQAENSFVLYNDYER